MALRSISGAAAASRAISGYLRHSMLPSTGQTRIGPILTVVSSAEPITTTSIHRHSLAHQALHPSSALPIRYYSTTCPTYKQRRGTFVSKKAEKKGSGKGSPKTKKRNERRKKKRAALSGQQRKRKGVRKGSGGGSGSGGEGLGLLPSLDSDDDDDASFDDIASGYQNYGNDYDYNNDGGGRRRLYYYQSSDDQDDKKSSDVPHAVLAKMKSDPTYFHGMDGMATYWLKPLGMPRSKDEGVQRVLKDILERQKLRRQGKGESSGWDGKVILRVPKKHVEATSSEKDGVIDRNVQVDDDKSENVSNEVRANVEAAIDDEHDASIAAVPCSSDESKDSPTASAVKENLSEEEHDTVDADEAEDEEDGSVAVAVAAPKVKRTAYLNFSVEWRMTIKEESPDLSFGEISKMIGMEWRAMSKEEKHKWAPEQYANAPPKGTVKLPKSAYIFYWIARRAEIQESNPEMPTKEVTKAVALDWRALGDDEKRVWDEKAAADRIRYEKELAAYQSTISQ